MTDTLPSTATEAPALEIKDLEMSCFDGHYVTGGIDEDYFQWLEQNCSS